MISRIVPSTILDIRNAKLINKTIIQIEFDELKGIGRGL